MKSGQTGLVQSRFHLLISLCVVALFMSACSSTTVVARDDRAAPTTQDPGGAEGVESSDGAEDDVEVEAGDESETDDGVEDTEDEPLTPRELEEAQGFGLGGAEQLASLEADCVADNDMACDILFELSGFDTPEEATALSCGGRADDAPIFCTDGVTALSDQLVFDPASEGLDDIVESCRGGDYTACDFLYFRSPFESEFEEIGGTCGDRVQVAVPDCRTFLG